MTPERAGLAVSLTDVTDLSDHCRPSDVESLCDRAATVGAAAVCVWPDFVAVACERLTESSVRVATVVNFPTGDERAFATGVLTERCLDDGADEVDVVMPYRAVLAGDVSLARELLATVRSVTAGRAAMKVILETGELDGRSSIVNAAELAVDCGADFIKTSTGRSSVSATPDAVAAMLEVIARCDGRVGLKVSGGVRTPSDAEAYLEMAESVMGEGFLTPTTFRFGASALLDPLTEIIRGDRSG